MDEKKQEILEKLAKIMLLAENQKGTPEGEAALNRASMLMAKHRIAESEIDMETDALMEDVVEGYMDEGGKRQWICDLSSSLAHTFDCRTFFYIHNMNIHFVGTDSDVETCTFFMEIVMHHIESEARLMWPADRNWRKRNEFGAAAMTVLSDRLWDMKKRMDVEEKRMGVSCTDLVISKNDKVTVAFEEAYPNLKSSRRKKETPRDRKTWAAGKAAGKSAPLNKGIESGPNGHIE